MEKCGKWEPPNSAKRNRLWGNSNLHWNNDCLGRNHSHPMPSLSHPLLGNPSISLLADYKPLRLRTWYQKASRKAVHSCHIIHQNVWSDYGRMVKSCVPRRSKKLLGTLHATIAAHRQGTPSTMASDVKTQLHEVTISTGSKVPQLKPPFQASLHRSD